MQYKISLASISSVYDLIIPNTIETIKNNLDKEVLLINGVAIDSVFDDFADQNSISNDKNIRKNEAIQFFSNRNVLMRHILRLV
jgi:hypothetical protein